MIIFFIFKDLQKIFILIIIVLITTVRLKFKLQKKKGCIRNDTTFRIKEF